jgi:hypothetical protein
MTDQEAQSDTVDSPFVFLAPQFDWAFSETAPGEGLPRLSQRFSELRRPRTAQSGNCCR